MPGYDSEYNLLTNPCVSVIEGDGPWTIGYRYEAKACGRIFQLVENCDAPPPASLPTPQVLPGYEIVPFGLYERQVNSSLCIPEDLAVDSEKALACATGQLVSDALWAGPLAPISSVTPGAWNQTVYLESAEVQTTSHAPITSSFLAQAALAKLIDEAYAAHPELACCGIIHLGTQAALILANDFEYLDLNIVTSPAYPTLGMAITGPIGIRLGSIQTTQNYNGVYKANDIYTESTRIAAFEFDLCMARRVVFA